MLCGPKTTIDTAAVRNLLGGETLAKMSRTPQILAEPLPLLSSIKPPLNAAAIVLSMKKYLQRRATPIGEIFSRAWVHNCIRFIRGIIISLNNR
jgi:hypothetical protein